MCFGIDPNKEVESVLLISFVDGFKARLALLHDKDSRDQTKKTERGLIRDGSPLQM